jgi:hypothetical protein
LRLLAGYLLILKIILTLSHSKVFFNLLDLTIMRFSDIGKLVIVNVYNDVKEEMDRQQDVLKKQYFVFN